MHSEIASPFLYTLYIQSFGESGIELRKFWIRGGLQEYILRIKCTVGMGWGEGGGGGMEGRQDIEKRARGAQGFWNLLSLLLREEKEGSWRWGLGNNSLKGARRS